MRGFVELFAPLALNCLLFYAEWAPAIQKKNSPQTKTGQG